MAWQDSWIFRIVDQETGAAVSGVPVSIVDPSGRGGYWVSDVDGIVRIPKHDRARLSLRVGLRNEETIELDARSLPDDPIPLAAPRELPSVARPPAPPAARAPFPAAAAAAAAAAPSEIETHPQLGHLARYARIVVHPQDGDITLAPGVAPIASPLPSVASDRTGGAMRYGVLLEIEQVWQSLGAQAGDTLFSVSLGPGDEVQLIVSDGRWRKSPSARERPLQVVAKMVGARQFGDAADGVPLDAVVESDLAAVATDTVRLLVERTERMSESLRRRPLGVTELESGETPAGVSIRTLRNLRAEGVLSYHFFEPVERYRVIVRAPRLRPALLVPFRLPNIATREVVRRFGHALRRGLVDRRFAPDVDAILSSDEPAAAVEQRLYEHIAAHLPYYSATIIAAGDPAERFFALAKLRDPRGRPLTDIIENAVVGRVGNFVAFALRSVEFTTLEWRKALSAAGSAPLARAGQDFTVVLPLPGTWLRSELFPAQLASDTEAARAEGSEEEGGRAGGGRRKRG
ncbi:MAG TPA: hypothetical protein VGU74_10525 [Gemmatimonadales bacterium]|nr:hypothetical protein [Gemmatimonadales bacterium]